MENEIRFYYSKKELPVLLALLRNQSELVDAGRFYEKTMQFDHPEEQHSFYSKEVDGRFRVRVSKKDNSSDSKAMISWKKRLNKTDNGINTEEEVEVVVGYNQIDNLLYILKNVIFMKEVESYERYRNIFSNNDIEICIDEYPFGIALEIEHKSKDKKYSETIPYWLDKLKLNISNSYHLSWDDKYKELCKNQDKKIEHHVLFSKDMPII